MLILLRSLQTLQFPFFALIFSRFLSLSEPSPTAPLPKLSLPREERMKSPLVLTVLLSLITAKLCHAYCIESQEQQIPSGMQTKVRVARILLEEGIGGCW